MFAVFRKPDFARLWVAGAISGIGDQLLYLALPFYVYQLTNSASATALTVFAQTLPRVAIGSFAGVFADRWDRRVAMISADLARAFVLAPLLASYSANRVWLIDVVLFLLAGIGQFFGPTKSALIPEIVGTEELTSANALNALGDNVALLIGPALGGALFLAVGPGGAVVADSFSFVASAVLIGRIVYRPTVAVPTPSIPAPPRKAALHAQWIDGLDLIRRARGLRILVAAIFAAMLGNGVITALLIPFITQILNADAGDFGWIITAQAAGGIIGGLVISRLAGLVDPARLVALSVGLIGVAFLTCFNARSLPLVIAMAPVLGVGVVGFGVGIRTWVQIVVPERFRGRVFGTIGSVSNLAMLGGSGVAGLASAAVGTLTPLNVAATLIVTSAVLLALAQRHATSARGEGFAWGLAGEDA